MGSSLPSLVLLLVGYAAAAQLPSSLKTCKQNDPDFNGCLKKAFTDALPVLVKVYAAGSRRHSATIFRPRDVRPSSGIPSLGLPPLDPLHFTQIKIKDSPERPVTLSLEFNEVDIIGNGNAIIDDVEMKPGSYYMKTKVHTDKPLTLVGPYKAEGKVLVLPVKGEGNSNITAPRLEAVLELFGQPIERDGEVYWDVTDYKVDLSVGKLSIDLTGLYNNDKALADNTLKFLNENSEEIAKEVVPVIQEALAASFKEMAERVFSKVPYNSVFPPS